MDKRQAEQWLSDKIEEADRKAKFWNERTEMLRVAMYGLTHPSSFEAVEAKELLSHLEGMEENSEYHQRRKIALLMSMD